MSLSPGGIQPTAARGSAAWERQGKAQTAARGWMLSRNEAKKQQNIYMCTAALMTLQSALILGPDYRPSALLDQPAPLRDELPFLL